MLVRAIRFLLLVGLAFLVVSLAACSGPDPAKPAPSPDQPAPSTAEAEPTWPLTGEPVDAPADHPALAVKISNVQQAHPQVGVDHADLVFVEPIGPAYTRLAAIFHSDVPEAVGPVRSVRPMDAPLLSPMAPAFANSGGAGWVMDYLWENADVDDLGTQVVPGTGAYEIDGARPAPDHVIAQPEILLGLTEYTAPPAPQFVYTPSPADGVEAAEAEINYEGMKITWTYDGERYLRAEPFGRHVTADGVQVGARNVLVLQVESKIEKYGDGSGQAVPVLQVIDSSGPLTLYRDGLAIEGTWSKGGLTEPFDLRDLDGDPLGLAPGNTWVELPG